MSRPVAGLACRIRIPVRQYQAVALLVREQSHVIRLMHRDAGLSLDVEEFESFATAEEYRDRLAGFLDLPSVIAAGTPSREDTLSTATPGTRREPHVQGAAATLPHAPALRRPPSPSKRSTDARSSRATERSSAAT